MELTSVTFMSTFMVVGWEGKHPIYLFTSKCNITTFSWATIIWISCKPNVIFKTELLQNLTKIIDIFDGHFSYFSNSNWIGDNYIRHSGFLPLADANDVILLFPQVSPHFYSTLAFPGSGLERRSR